MHFLLNRGQTWLVLTPKCLLVHLLHTGFAVKSRNVSGAALGEVVSVRMLLFSLGSKFTNIFNLKSCALIFVNEVDTFHDGTASRKEERGTVRLLDLLLA